MYFRAHDIRSHLPAEFEQLLLCQEQLSSTAVVLLQVCVERGEKNIQWQSKLYHQQLHFPNNT